MGDLKRNQLYQGAFASAKNIGETLNKIKMTPPVTSQPTVAPTASTPVNVGNISNTLKSLGSMTTGYNDSTKFEKVHPGVDFANAEGTPIRAAVTGKVVQVDKDTGKGFGNSAVIQDSNGNYVRWSHLNNSYVKVGDTVNPDTVVGGMGHTGSVYSNSGGLGTHTDLRIYNAAKQYLNPLTYLK